VKRNIAEAAIVSAFYLKAVYESNKILNATCKDEFNSLRQYIWTHCQKEIKEFGMGIFDNELEL
jgi:hypothetical protein